MSLVGGHWLMMSLADDITGWRCHYLTSLADAVTGWRCHWLVLSLADITGRRCHWLMISLADAVTGWYHWPLISLAVDVTGCWCHWLTMSLADDVIDWRCHWLMMSCHWLMMSRLPARPSGSQAEVCTAGRMTQRLLQKPFMLGMLLAGMTQRSDQEGENGVPGPSIFMEVLGICTVQILIYQRFIINRLCLRCSSDGCIGRVTVTSSSLNLKLTRVVRGKSKCDWHADSG